MSQQAPAAAAAPQPRLQIALNALGLAPENLRADEPEDADVPRLAETIGAAGLIYPLLVRKGRRGEAPYMVLDGRRRRFALLRLAAEGRLAADHPVDCVLAQDRAAQAAAAVLPNAEHAPVHLADVILAIGKLRRTRLSTTAIAEALGYDETEVRRLEAMAQVHPDVLQAFRLGKLSLRQVRLFARLKDKARQAELARDALAGAFFEGALQNQVTGARVTQDDPRFELVTAETYAAAGGRLKADLFGELPAEVLDPEALDACWREAAGRLAQALAEEGLTLLFARERGFAAPDGLAHAPFVYWGGLTDTRRAEFDAARERIEAAASALEAASEDERVSAVAELMRARLALAKLTAGRGEVEAVLLTPVRGGLDLTFFHRPAAEPPADPAEAEADGGGDEPEEELEGDGAEAADPPRLAAPVEVEGVSHAQHAAHTDMATRGLIRALADHGETALVALTAHLFGEIVLQRGGDSVLRIRAFETLRPRDDNDPTAEVWARVETFRSAYAESGLTLLGYVAGLDDETRGRLLALVTAVTLDLRESRTDGVRAWVRSQAAELAALSQADLSRHWTPDAEFLALHTRDQLLAFLEQMGAEVPKPEQLRKPELVQAVVEAAGTRRWLPDFLRWPYAQEAEAAPEETPETADDVEP